ncbi:MAG: hypothetical protein QOH73_2557 [Gaiellaceae bacterium]|nr:hypothetical protein [Gaiellaceae bacterium]
MNALAEQIAEHATAESPLWAASLRPDPSFEPVFSPLAPAELALALETIYEGYLLHYGDSRLFAPADRDTALLLGDALYAQGLVHLAALGATEPVRAMAELISLCAQQRGDEVDGDGEAWAATAERLGAGAGADARRLALEAHTRLLG